MPRNTVTKGISFSPEVLKAAQKRAREAGISFSNYVNRSVLHAVKTNHPDLFNTGPLRREILTVLTDLDVKGAEQLLQEEDSVAYGRKRTASPKKAAKKKR